jgi:hypothetical protein
LSLNVTSIAKLSQNKCFIEPIIFLRDILYQIYLQAEDKEGIFENFDLVNLQEFDVFLVKDKISNLFDELLS